ncbi:VPS41 [Cordylochernes scorpioides]|uniref:VPS41 n=1 Tax=Cordylochernes scorpioides TaxID=51811 RepID=A0ABY6L327_9ARAC|nr:VPS41 [Cordylochernes scorpioides]
MTTAAGLDVEFSFYVCEQFLALGTHYGFVYILDHDGNKIKGTDVALHTCTVNQISLDLKGEHMASCSDDGKVVVVNLCQTNTRPYAFFMDRPVKAVALDPHYNHSSCRLVSGGDKQAFKKAHRAIKSVLEYFYERLKARYCHARRLARKKHGGSLLTMQNQLLGWNLQFQKRNFKHKLLSVLPVDNELLLTADKVCLFSSPGIDGMLPVLIVKLVEHFRTVFLNIFNKCLTTGHFLSLWKLGDIVLIPKRSGEDFLASRCPITMLSGLGNIHENLVLARLSWMADRMCKAPPNYFGIKPCRSTTAALLNLKSTFTWMIKNRKLCLLLSSMLKALLKSVAQKRLSQKHLSSDKLISM